MNISFFARSYFPAVGQHSPTAETDKPIIYRASSLLRGQQMAEYLGGKYNPTDGFKNDIRIWVKPRSLRGVKCSDYVDICDGEYLAELLLHRPDIKLITSSLATYEYFKENYPNEVVLIPTHHCNFERIRRTRKEVITGGYFTAPSKETYTINAELKRRLNKIGLEFYTIYDWTRREDIIDFYQKIDFQVGGHFYKEKSELYRHPSKVINAASFGIPTISHWRSGYRGAADMFVPVNNMDSLMKEVVKLLDKEYYNAWSARLIEQSEIYHISNIACMYMALASNT